MIAINFVLINVLLSLVWRFNCTLKAGNLIGFDSFKKKTQRKIMADYRQQTCFKSFYGVQSVHIHELETQKGESL